MKKLILYGSINIARIIINDQKAHNESLVAAVLLDSKYSYDFDLVPVIDHVQLKD